MMTKNKIIIIPISLDAVDRLNYDINLDGDLIEISLNYSEYQNLSSLGLFDVINEYLMLNLGEYEDELIFNDKFDTLENILLSFKITYPSNIVLVKFHLICNMAFKLNTAIFLSF